MIRVAAYCRVSTDQEDQANSFESQKRYFRDCISRHPDWELCGIYADEGITGTSTKNRTQFNRMIEDALQGKVQLIVTKEVSRFSRNILDTISYTRALKAAGVGVRFLMDGIDTLSPDAELYLAIMASIAQEESRKTSGRVVWGQTRQMERGIVFGPSLLGYDVKNGKITIEPAGAEIVRLIFQKYAAEGLSAGEIAGQLTKNGYRTYRGNTRWSPGAVIKILKNEKYVGDLVQKKTYTPDYLTHEKRKNTGQVPLIRITNHHEPVISRDIWETAQLRLRQNNRHAGSAVIRSGQYLFSGRIRCGECGSTFVARNKYLKDGTKIRRWSCASAVRGGSEKCSIGKLLRHDDAQQMLKTALQSLRMDREAFAGTTASLVMDAVLEGEREPGGDLAQLEREKDRCLWKKEAMLDSFFSGELSKDEMNSLKRRYDAQLESVNRQLEEAKHRSRENILQEDALKRRILAIVNGETRCEIFWKTMLDSLTVYKDRHMELRLQHLPHIFLFIG